MGDFMVGPNNTCTMVTLTGPIRDVVLEGSGKPYRAVSSRRVRSMSSRLRCRRSCRCGCPRSIEMTARVDVRVSRVIILRTCGVSPS
jgi:hypothetical protein